MKQKLIRAAAWLLAAALCVPMLVLVCFAQDLEAPTVSAKSALVLDCTGGRVLYEKNADEPSLIASTTKIMTALVVAETCNLDSRVLVPDQAVGVEGSSMYLQQGEVLTVRDLMYGMLLHSGNDAAVALAIYCAGDVGSFVELMNQKARDLGLANTSFANPNGLDDDANHSTARDLAKLAAAALENETVAQIVACKTASCAGRTLTNHNKLLWRYPGAVGVKTGYTKAAGRILVSAAQRESRRLVAVTISDPDDWQDHQKLLDYGFDAFGVISQVQAGQELAWVPILWGSQDELALKAEGNIACALAQGETAALRLTLPGLLPAPVEAGTPLGTVQVLVGDTVVGQTALLAAESVSYEMPDARRGSILRSIFSRNR